LNHRKEEPSVESYSKENLPSLHSILDTRMRPFHSYNKSDILPLIEPDQPKPKKVNLNRYSFLFALKKFSFA